MLYLDSAQIADAQAIQRFPWIKGITTNPTLLAQSELSPERTLERLARLTPGELYYQLLSEDVDGMIREGEQAAHLIGEKLVLKIPAVPAGFVALAYLSPQIACSVTAIYHPSQALIAAEGGAKYAIAYVNRATRLLGDGCALVRSMAQILQGSATTILAASIKSPDEAIAAIAAGAHHLTLPLPLLLALTHHDLSQQTMKEFNAQGKGLKMRRSGRSVDKHKITPPGI